ncbi:MAG: alpha/beta hydrolase [Chitinophagaceae bacterium]|nr:alpha/beta hydrolase [Chitinophagaceae bacterium]
MTPSTNTKSKHVLFVTGAFVTHLGWKPWQQFFESRGFQTVAPPWPFKDGTPEELRNRQPNDTDLALLTLDQLIDHYAKIAKSLPEKPIAIGHSLGGLITQILLNRDIVAAAAVLHPVPPLGVFPYEWSFLRGGWKSLGLFTSIKKTYLMSLKDWQYAFVNGMSLEDQRKAWEENTIPESKTVARGGLTKAAKLDFKKTHGPLLIVGGGTDHIIPAHLNRRNFKAYKKDNGSVTEYKEFPNSNHFVVGLPTWQQEANFIYDWFQQHA